MEYFHVTIYGTDPKLCPCLSSMTRECILYITLVYFLQNMHFLTVNSLQEVTICADVAVQKQSSLQVIHVDF